jgi:hypothetical protein
MKRLSLIILIVVSSAVIGLTGSGASTSPAVQITQKKSSTTLLRTTHINAQTINALTRGKKVVADLTKRGVVYQFDPGAGQIDFNRVVVRTPRGEVTISSLLQTMIPKDKLKGFKYTTQSFRLGTQRTGKLSTTLPTTSNFECKPTSCLCHGLEDCEDLIIGTSLCRSWLCAKDEHGEYICLCFRDF